jgi:hypothetical protein
MITTARTESAIVAARPRPGTSATLIAGAGEASTSGTEASGNARMGVICGPPDSRNWL